VATFGETEVRALRHAVDAIETAFASMIDDGDDIPRRSRSATGIPVRLPLMTILKLQTLLGVSRLRDHTFRARSTAWLET
jgi:hypothetical protein